MLSLPIIAFRKIPPATVLLATASLCLLASAAFAARDEDHWSFQPITRPAIPAVSNKDWSAHPIDAFILARLEAAKLTPSPEAAPETLLRRLHLDLTGLLPTPAQVKAFTAAWKRDPEIAYGETVDSLLDSPHFGEQWGRHWLDMARYADSDGYLGDTMRPWAWIYRDWVIDAVNADQPFDQFTIEQLAGDLLPEATQSQKIATGFHRNNLNNTEAGADRELNRTKQVVDRVSATGTTWLGLTLACAECHDHKHDPVTQKEFFQLYSFFNNTDDADISVRLEDEWQTYEAKRKTWETRLTALEKPLLNFKPAPTLAAPSDTPWSPLKPDKVDAAGTDLAIQPDGSILASGKTPSTVTYFVEAPVEKAVTITGFQLEAFGSFGEGRTPGKTVGRGKDGAFILSMFFPDLIVDGKAKRLKLASTLVDHADPGEGAAVPHTIDPTNEGWRVASKTYQPHRVVFELAEPARLPAGSRLKFSLGQKFGTGNLIRHFQLSTTTAPGPFKAIAPVVDPEFAALRLPLEKHLANAPAKPPTKSQTLVERTKERRDSFVHIRGDYASPGDPVTSGTPAILHPIAARNKKPDRLDLARWLFDEKNPLTARVAANQIWQHLFGIGIVPTPDDFGTEGARPTHPQLLDYLATEFQSLGWSRKALIRHIVQSKAYRQSSRVRPELAEHPTGNTLLWRQNAYRVSAENVRDVHLTAAGLLTRKIGGPGIRPPLPEFVTMVGRTVKWPVSEGPERYRRGMYIVLKRTVLYPMLTAFDAPDTSISCSRRERTNTPMQALTLLNDPVFFECSQALGIDLHARHGKNTDAALRDLFTRCLARPPQEAELQTLRAAHRDLAQSAANAEDALTATARIVMNLDEFVTRE